MNIEEAINKIKEVIYMSDGEKVDYIDINHSDLGGEVSVDIFIKAIENLLTAYEKEKEKNKKAIDFINQRKKIVNKDMAEGTRLQVGTFMWQVDELLEILKGVEEE